MRFIDASRHHSAACYAEVKVNVCAACCAIYVLYPCIIWAFHCSSRTNFLGIWRYSIIQTSLDLMLSAATLRCCKSSRTELKSWRLTAKRQTSMMNSSSKEMLLFEKCFFSHVAAFQEFSSMVTQFSSWLPFLTFHKIHYSSEEQMLELRVLVRVFSDMKMSKLI